jgi:hypothetical protein
VRAGPVARSGGFDVLAELVLVHCLDAVVGRAEAAHDQGYPE